MIVPMAKDSIDSLPKNLEAEIWVLGSIMRDSQRYLPIVRALLQPDDFCLDKHVRLFRRALELDDSGVGVNRVTLAEALRSHREFTSVGIGYLNSLDDDLPEIIDIASYARVVKEKATRRRIIVWADALGKRAFSPAENNETLLASAQESLRRLQSDSGHAPEAPPAAPQWPKPLHADAFHGVAGELVRIIEPHSEADVAALLVQTLIGWGSLAGRGPYYLAEADRHHTNESGVIVGATAKGRKGTSWGRIWTVLNTIDQHWSEERQLAGLGSGEALIDAVGEQDHRTLVIESEFARLLAVVSREGSTISANLRNGWDTGTLSIHTRQKKVKVSGAHLSLIGHITREELLRRLDSTETANGFGNRILWVCARRSKSLPHGGGDMKIDSGLLNRLKQATDKTRKMGNTPVKFDAEAASLWEQVYDDSPKADQGCSAR
jgi:hypothetical protein